MMASYCKDCDSREVGCHGRCEKYLQAAENRKEEREKAREYNQKAYGYGDYTTMGRRKRKR